MFNKKLQDKYVHKYMYIGMLRQLLMTHDLYSHSYFIFMTQRFQSCIDTRQIAKFLVQLQPIST